MINKLAIFVLLLASFGLAQGVAGDPGVGDSPAGGGGGGGTNLFVQSTGANAATSPSITCTAGNLLFMYGWTDKTVPRNLTPSSTNGESWAVVTNTDVNAVHETLYMWKSLCVGGATVGSFSGGASDLSIAIAEYSSTGTKTLDATQKYEEASLGTVTMTSTAAVNQELMAGAVMDIAGSRFSTSTSGCNARNPAGATFITLLDCLNVSAGAFSIAATSASGYQVGVMGLYK